MIGIKSAVKTLPPLARAIAQSVPKAPFKNTSVFRQRDFSSQYQSQIDSVSKASLRIDDFGTRGFCDFTNIPELSELSKIQDFVQNHFSKPINFYVIDQKIGPILGEENLTFPLIFPSPCSINPHTLEAESSVLEFTKSNDLYKGCEDILSKCKFGWFLGLMLPIHTKTEVIKTANHYAALFDHDDSVDGDMGLPESNLEKFNNESINKVIDQLISVSNDGQVSEQDHRQIHAFHENYNQFFKPMLEKTGLPFSFFMETLKLYYRSTSVESYVFGNEVTITNKIVDRNRFYSSGIGHALATNFLNFHVDFDDLSSKYLILKHMFSLTVEAGCQLNDLKSLCNDFHKLQRDTSELGMDSNNSEDLKKNIKYNQVLFNWGKGKSLPDSVLEVNNQYLECLSGFFKYVDMLNFDKSMGHEPELQRAVVAMHMWWVAHGAWGTGTGRYNDEIKLKIRNGNIVFENIRSTINGTKRLSQYQLK